MPKAHESTTETLFHHWRRGDAGAGKAMAQRFTDWYYAIAVSRLGETEGERPFRAACSKFSKGVVKVEDPRRLLGWAHNIARKQVHTRIDGGRMADGDLPNAFSRKKSPKALLASVREALPKQMQLLEASYAGTEPIDDPVSVLQARYQVKEWMRDHLDLPFKVTPRDPDPDRAPLPLYEAGRLADDSEDVHFELYMLNEREVCQDVAEFAHFALALRGGLAGARPAKAPEAAAAPAPAPVAPAAAPAPAPAAPVDAPAKAVPREAGPSQTGHHMPILAVVFFLGMAAVVGILWYMTRGYV